MALIGLVRRSQMCKICLSFDDEILSQLTVDALMKRRTHEEICKYYTTLLPKEVIFDINPLNLRNHLNHCDISLIAEENLRDKGQPVTEGDFASKLFAERFKERIDKQLVLHSLYQSRINKIQFLNELFTDKQATYSKLKIAPETDHIAKSRLKGLEKEIRDIVTQLDDIESNVQQVILKDIAVEKGPGNTYINQNFVNVFEDSLKGFMGEFIPYLLYTAFKDDIEKGKEVVAKLSSMMDNHLSPTLNKVNQMKLLASSN